jgi:general secretion pathway protein C
MRLNLDARTRAILRRLPVVNVYSLAELVLLAVLAVQCARLTWTIATPVAPLGDWRAAEPAIPADPAAVLRDFDAFFRISGAQGPRAVTSLNVKLFGVRVDEASGRGSAIVAGPDGVQKSVSVGEEIAPGVKLSAVAFDHVTIDRGGAAEDLFVVQGSASPAAPTLGSAPPAPAPARPGGITADQFATEVGFVPRIDGGRISGLAVRPQGSGEAFRAAGLREGDVITSLGGRPVTGQGDLQRIASEAPRGGLVSMVVERGGATLPLSVRVSPQGGRP